MSPNGVACGSDAKGIKMSFVETGPTFADLSRDLLETADLEVVTSLVELPPSFQLPTHRHPGEEFAYVIDGAIHLWMHGADSECHMPAGTFAKIPLRAVHYVRTGEDQGAKLIVFRVHTPGAPERARARRSGRLTSRRSNAEAWEQPTVRWAAPCHARQFSSLTRSVGGGSTGPNVPR